MISATRVSQNNEYKRGSRLMFDATRKRGIMRLSDVTRAEMFTYEVAY